MILGPDQIVACPHCDALLRHGTLRSGNTFRASVWTDCKRVTPMLRNPPDVMRCQDCGSYSWLAEALRVGTVDKESDTGSQVDPSWLAAKRLQEPTEEEYYEAIRKGLARDANEERFLRTLAWWRSNDKFRQGVPREADNVRSVSEEWKMNLRAIVNLLNEEDEKDLFMKAAALRELGEFDAAQQVLGLVSSDTYAPYVSQLNSLCEARDTEVRQFQSGSFAKQEHVLRRSLNVKQYQVLSALKSFVKNSINLMNQWVRRIMRS